MKERTKRIISFSSHVICFGMALNLCCVFLFAYFNDYRILVTVNDYGEAHIELILIPLTLVFCSIGLYFAWRHLKSWGLKYGIER